MDLLGPLGFVLWLASLKGGDKVDKGGKPATGPVDMGGKPMPGPAAGVVIPPAPPGTIPIPVVPPGIPAPPVASPPTTPPDQWPSPAPASLPPWPSGWRPVSHLTPDVVQRAWHWNPILWDYPTQRIVKPFAQEQFGGRWLTFVAKWHGKAMATEAWEPKG
jgi:hypothetical protein